VTQTPLPDPPSGGGSTWDPAQYAKFARERRQPFDDLLALVGDGPRHRGVDLGCGSGELTIDAAHRLALTEMLGIDNSPSMLAEATATLDGCGDGVAPHVRFELGDIATWTADGDVDVVLAAASLQWVSDHPAVLARWAAALSPGGWLAVQVPTNADAATHRVAASVADRPEYLVAFGPSGPPADPVASNVLPPERYARILHDLGLVDQQVVLKVYPHVLATAVDAVEWVQGTTLTRFRAALAPDVYERFVEDYRDAFLDEVGDASPFFFPFKRILMVARRPA
jgi:trans-aconitate 2-methyltransferase